MNTTFRLGRIAGIPIGLSWTWIPVRAAAAVAIIRSRRS